MSYDEMELDMIGDQKTAMFVIISDTDDTFNFVVAIMYTQLFNQLCDHRFICYIGKHGDRRTCDIGIGNFDRKFLYEDHVCTHYGYLVCPYDRNLPLYLSCTNPIRNDEQ